MHEQLLEHGTSAIANTEGWKLQWGELKQNEKKGTLMGIWAEKEDPFSLGMYKYFFSQEKILCEGILSLFRENMQITSLIMFTVNTYLSFIITCVE